MNRYLPTILLLVGLSVATVSGIAKDGGKLASPTKTLRLDLTIDLPPCQRDVQAWNDFSPTTLWWDSHLRTLPYKQKEIQESDANWRNEHAVDVTWVDINGDGWCDVVTSGAVQPYKNAKGRPILILEPRGIYLHTQQGFNPFKPGMIKGEYEGSSLVIYWDKISQASVIYKRTFQGNLVGGVTLRVTNFMCGKCYARHSLLRRQEI